MGSILAAGRRPFRSTVTASSCKPFNACNIMSLRRLVVLAWMFAALAASCGPVSPVHNQASGARVESPTPVTTASTSSTSNSERLVLAQLSGASTWVVLDVTDIGRPVTVASLGQSWPYGEGKCGLGMLVRFVSASELVGVSDSCASGTARLATESLDGSAGQTVVTSSGNIFGFGSSVDGTTWTYYVANDPNPQGAWHLLANGSDRVIDSSGGLGPGEFFADAGILVASAYSNDGRFMSLSNGDEVDIFNTAGALLNTWHHSTGPVPDGHDMVWTGDRLLFTTLDGIEQWDDKGLSLAVPGLRWIRAKLSPDGTQIVFHTNQAAGLPQVEVMNVTSLKTTKVSPSGGTEGWFLDGTHVWYRGIEACPSPCGFQSYQPTGAAYVADLSAGTVVASRIVQVADTWPRPGEASVPWTSWT